MMKLKNLKLIILICKLFSIETFLYFGISNIFLFYKTSRFYINEAKYICELYHTLRNYINIYIKKGSILLIYRSEKINSKLGII